MEIERTGDLASGGYAHFWKRHREGSVRRQGLPKHTNVAARRQALQRSGFSPKNKSAVGLRAILRIVYRTVPNETKRKGTERYANGLGRCSATLHSGFVRIFAKRNGIELNDFGNVFLTHTVTLVSHSDVFSAFCMNCLGFTKLIEGQDISV